MKVRVKVKHLFWLGCSLLAIWLLLSFVIVPQFTLYQTEKRLANGDNAAKGELFTLLEKGRLVKNQQWRLIEHYMLQDELDHSFDVVVSPSFTYAATPTTVRFFPDEIEPFLKKYIQEAPANDSVRSAAKQLAYNHANNGKTADAYRVLAATQERFTSKEKAWERNHLYLDQAELAIYLGDVDQAEQFIHQATEITEDDFFQAELTLVEAKLQLKQGDVAKALQLVKQGKSKLKVAWEKEQEMFPDEQTDLTSYVAYDHTLTLQTHLENALAKGGEGVVTVSGQLLRKDGAPLAHAGVFLREQHVSSRSIQPNEPYQTTTDENGKFTFHGVIPGNYQVNLGLTFDQVDGWVWAVSMDEWIRVDGTEDIRYDMTLQPLLHTYSPANDEIITEENVTFTWEAFADAAYYDLSLGIETEGGSSSVVFKTKVRQTELKVAVEELYAKTVGMLFADTPLEKVDGAGSLLAFANPNTRFFWSVQAYDANDHLLTKSDGYRLSFENMGEIPTFYVKEREVTEADQLLLQGKAPAALRAYEEAYKQNPKDVHSLRMIMRMIGSESERTGKSEAQLITPYLAELVQLDEATPDDIFQLAEYYAELQQWEKFQQTFAAYSDAVQGELSYYDKEIYALALMHQGKLVEARKELRKLMHQEKGNPQLGTLLALEIGIDHTFDEALLLAKTYPAALDPWQSPIAWETVVKELEATTKNDAEQFPHLQTGLDLFFAGEEEKLSKWLAAEKNQAMKNFFEAVLEE